MVRMAECRDVLDRIGFYTYIIYILILCFNSTKTTNILLADSFRKMSTENKQEVEGLIKVEFTLANS